MKLSKQSIHRLKTKYGSWVLITGASSGIGKELAIRFAEAGFKLVITGRRAQALNEISTFLFDSYGAEVIPVTGDLSYESCIDELIDETSHLPIGIAILNAGFGTSGKFLEADIEQETNMLDLNCKAVVQLAHHYARSMQDLPHKGALIFMSSIVAFQGVPNAAHYAATKAYVQSLAEALAIELKPEGIDVLSAAPGPVASGFAKRSGMIMNQTLKPENVGVPIINAIGKRTSVLPGLLTKFLMYNLRMTPRWAKVRIMGKVMGGFTKHQLSD